MNNDGILSGKKIAILATDGFEQSELEEPRRALDKAGALTYIISPKEDVIRGWDGDEFGDRVDGGGGVRAFFF
jgi:protease I